MFLYFQVFPKSCHSAGLVYIYVWYVWPHRSASIFLFPLYLAEVISYLFVSYMFSSVIIWFVCNIRISRPEFLICTIICRILKNDVWLICLVSDMPAADAWWKTKVNTQQTNTHPVQATRLCFQYSMYPIILCLKCIPSNKKNILKNYILAKATSDASRHDRTPHCIILYKCLEKWEQGDPVYLNCRAQILGFLLIKTISFFQLL